MVNNGMAQADNDNVRGVTGKQTPFAPKGATLLFLRTETDK